MSKFLFLFLFLFSYNSFAITGKVRHFNVDSDAIGRHRLIDTSLKVKSFVVVATGSINLGDITVTASSGLPINNGERIGVDTPSDMRGRASFDLSDFYFYADSEQAEVEIIYFKWD